VQWMRKRYAPDKPAWKTEEIYKVIN